MKTNRIKIFIFPLVVACMFLGLTGCQINGNVIGMSDYYYEDSEKYVAGEAELIETANNIDINWMNGNVKVSSHNSDKLCLLEKSEKELKEETKLHYWLDNATLRIKFCSPGKWDLSELEKDLTILVPETLSISSLKVSTLSADVNLSNCVVTDLVNINTLSGMTEAEFSEPLNEFKGSSTSGSFKVSAPYVSRFDVDTVSGATNLFVEKEPDWLNIDNTSGSINLSLPRNASFTLSYDNTSGDLDSELVYSMSMGKYIFGEGHGEYNIGTVSGDVVITANEEEE